MNGSDGSFCFSWQFSLPQACFGNRSCDLVDEQQHEQINQRIKGYVNYDVNSTKEDTIESKKQLRRYIRYEARQICPDKEERTEILLDLHYHNKCNSQFFWDCVGDNIVERLEKMTYGDF